ncbi:CoA transferase [Streptomyces sp. NPDC050617]|uniref:CaiB/BaiF CoA transferase family protein n=1 Tax=Streptomyces sp. NPDC050617 TaxID=3154628 RepID=UPI0034412ECD
MTTADAPLSGVTVLDLSHVYAGPYATLMLAQAGARIVKIEPPTGEHLRRRGAVPGPRYAFAMLNSGKESLALDLKSAEGIALFKRLVVAADVLVENFTPGVMDRLGIGWDTLKEINPRLVYAQSSGYGTTGPYAAYPAMDLTVQAMAGVVSATGYPGSDPVKSGAAVCDFSAGINLYGAIATALFRRERTGRGGRVEVSMMESVFPMLMSSLSSHYSTGEEVERVGNQHPGLSVAPYSVFATKDGHVAIACEGDHHWRALAVLMGRPELGEDERYAGVKARVARREEVDELVAEWTGALTKEEAFERLRAAKVPSAPVRTVAEVASDPHLAARGYLYPQDHPELGPITAMGSPITFEVADRPARSARPLHADAEDLLRDLLAVGVEEYAQLAASGAFGPQPNAAR